MTEQARYLCDYCKREFPRSEDASNHEWFCAWKKYLERSHARLKNDFLAPNTPELIWRARGLSDHELRALLGVFGIAEDRMPPKELERQV